MTKLEKWFQDLQDLGCIVCLNEFGIKSPPDIHHIHKNGNRRVDDFHTIPLCPNHHRLGVNNEQYVSRHPWKAEFEKRYGSEWDLFEQVKELVRSSPLPKQEGCVHDRISRIQEDSTALLPKNRSR